MSQENHDPLFIAYDNPLSLSDLSTLYIARNIKHFVDEEIISERAFYLWKSGISFSDRTLEKLFQATLRHSGELNATWITLFSGSRDRAQQFIDALLNQSASGGRTGEAILFISFVREQIVSLV